MLVKVFNLFYHRGNGFLISTIVEPVARRTSQRLGGQSHAVRVGERHCEDQPRRDPQPRRQSREGGDTDRQRALVAHGAVYERPGDAVCPS